MTVGADKILSFDPPGAIGLIDRQAVMQLRFDEVDTDTRPQDVRQVLTDFEPPSPLAMPLVVPAALGRGRLFNAATMGLAAKDKNSGDTLLTRDASIQVALAWDASAQSGSGDPGVVIARGTGGSSAEYVSYGLRIDIVDVSTFTALVRWFWQDTAGVLKLQGGAQVILKPNRYTILTATRRWVSPTDVRLAYYIGDILAGEVTSVDGSIGGGTTGTMQLGHRTAAGSPAELFAGIIDELLVVGRELCFEEVEATWLRITKYQPLGVQLMRESLDEDFPISSEPDSDAQLDLRMTGHILGVAAAAAENLRSNFFPQRAYGTTLEQWEKAVAVTPKPANSIQERRARVLARLKQRLGISIPGLKEALVDLVDCDVDDLEFRAFSNDVRDDFAAGIDPVRWWVHPTGSATGVGGKARFAPGAGSYPYDDLHSDWLTMSKVVSQPWLASLPGLMHVKVKLVFTTPQSGVEVGIYVGDRAARNYLMLGLKDSGGTFSVVTERFLGHTSQVATTRATLGGNPAAIWLHLYESSAGQWIASWSTTSATTGFSSTAPFAHPSIAKWAGCYFRSVAAVGAAVADFDDFVLWTPNASRPFNAYVFRDPGLGGSPDIEGARSVIANIKHGFTHATITESMEFIVGTGGSLLGLDPL